MRFDAPSARSTGGCHACNAMIQVCMGSGDNMRDCGKAKAEFERRAVRGIGRSSEGCTAPATPPCCLSCIYIACLMCSAEGPSSAAESDSSKEFALLRAHSKLSAVNIKVRCRIPGSRRVNISREWGRIGIAEIASKR